LETWWPLGQFDFGLQKPFFSLKILVATKLFFFLPLGDLVTTKSF